MRQAGNVNIVEEDGVAHAIFLTGAGCGQHECGVDALLRFANIPLRTRFEGMPSRTADGPAPGVLHETFKSVHIPTTKKRTDASILWIGRDARNYPQTANEQVKRYLSFSTPINGAWDDSDLFVVAYGERHMAILAEFAEAIRAGDHAIWWGMFSQNPFDRPGLVLAIPSKVPDRLKQVMLESDQEHNRLTDAAEATGIKRRIDEANEASTKHPFDKPFGYYALAPGWKKKSRVGDLPIETAHEVMFYLNPQDQKNRNSGWFTVEELEAWLEGKGPILKENFDPRSAREETSRGPASP